MREKEKGFIKAKHEGKSPGRNSKNAIGLEAMQFTGRTERRNLEGSGVPRKDEQRGSSSWTESLLSLGPSEQSRFQNDLNYIRGMTDGHIKKSGVPLGEVSLTPRGGAG